MYSYSYCTVEILIPTFLHTLSHRNFNSTKQIDQSASTQRSLKFDFTRASKLLQICVETVLGFLPSLFAATPMLPPPLASLQVVELTKLLLKL
jgi:hypothetical protein